jgi:hypothetical protein
MEADGVPQGYDRWRRVGVVRKPVDRLWSLYKYLKRFGLDVCQEHDKVYTAQMRESVDRPFDEWIVHNERPFTTPYDATGQGRFFPAYCCRHPLPENRKSQFIYLRPDLGTHVYRYDMVEALYSDLDVKPPRINGTDESHAPSLSDAAERYVAQWFDWDIKASAGAFKARAF